MKRTVAAVRAEIHADLDRWHGEEYDRLAEMLDDLLHAHAHELAERVRRVLDSGEGRDWDWWDSATIPASIADYIDPEQP
ncbi:hypothetical protein ACIF6L_26520 [Kitasatospora sp. NPDC086009]|uniref:hypothetical protein n=1 Tax=unclassified Kitasatospora TaxID=2633591 RepID=UPI0037C827AB